MVRRFLEDKITSNLKHKSVLLLGPRQVGKSTLFRSLQPDLTIDLSDEGLYRQHLKDPELITRQAEALSEKKRLIFVDEIQRIPGMLNTIQALIDANKSLRFLLSGSSARKLARGRANLLPGRILMEKLYPLTSAELIASSQTFDVNRAIQVGLLPEVYLSEIGAEILRSYADIYLREEIQAEAHVKDIASYARFLDLAAEFSGQFINYAKVSSDTGIPKDTVRGFFEILEETLLITRVPSFGEVDSARKTRQKDRYFFFDIGVRNAVLGKQDSKFTNTEKGPLFEHLLFQQLHALKNYRRPDWSLKTYRDDRGLEVDFILESENELILIEAKYQRKFRVEFEEDLLRLESLVEENPKLRKKFKKIQKIVVYAGDLEQKTEFGTWVLPLQAFLERVVAR
ncbi:MAG: ATP-binding protein [Bdellovibrionales bacterium]|nr:ATP-binding protein [Bdellovibrionales bacterium]